MDRFESCALSQCSEEKKEDEEEEKKRDAIDVTSSNGIASTTTTPPHILSITPDTRGRNVHRTQQSSADQGMCLIYLCTLYTNNQ